jgi:hypothetical protein
MATSPNFNWPEPDNTDLVKNGALAIRTAVNAIDTSLVDLKGGTTGQVLAKASGTDMDFSWVAQDDSNAIQNSIVDAKGDLIAATANDTPARLAVGVNDLFLTAASGETTGLKWTGTWTSFTPAYGGLTVGNGTNTGKYLQIGKIVFVASKFVFGSTSSVTGSPIQQYMPITAANAETINVGNCWFLDAGTADYAGFVIKATTALVSITAIGAAGTYATPPSTSSAIPFTWTTNDQMNLNYCYEVA